MILEVEMRIAEKAARIAGQIALDLIHDGTVNFKDNDEGPVTKADLAADVAIREILSHAFPNDQIITEESFPKGAAVPDHGRVWFVDPVDGTSYFVKGEDDYAVMIGLVVDQEPVLGVVFQPATGVLWRAIDTRAASLHFLPMFYCERLEANHLKPFRCDVSHQQIINSEPTAVASLRNPTEFIEFLTAELAVARIVKKGSVGLKLALIAGGQADFYLTSTKRMKLWDTCAPSVILSAAGGVTKSLDGHKLRFFGSIEHGCEIYAATPGGEQWLKERLPKAIKKWQHRVTSNKL